MVGTFDEEDSDCSPGGAWENVGGGAALYQVQEHVRLCTCLYTCVDTCMDMNSMWCLYVCDIR